MSTYRSADRLRKLAESTGWTVTVHSAGRLRFERGTQIATVRFREDGAVATAGYRRAGVEFYTWISSRDLANLLAEKGD